MKVTSPKYEEDLTHKMKTTSPKNEDDLTQKRRRFTQKKEDDLTKKLRQPHLKIKTTPEKIKTTSLNPGYHGVGVIIFKKDKNDHFL